MTWYDAADRYPDGTAGVYIVRFASGRRVAGKVPWWLWLVLGPLGITLPDDSVVVLKGALKWPFRRSWLAVHIQGNALAEVEFGAAGFVGGKWLGPAGERAPIVRAVRKWAEGQG